MKTYLVSCHICYFLLHIYNTMGFSELHTCFNVLCTRNLQCCRIIDSTVIFV